MRSIRRHLWSDLDSPAPAGDCFDNNRRATACYQHQLACRILILAFAQLGSRMMMKCVLARLDPMPVSAFFRFLGLSTMSFSVGRHGSHNCWG